MEPASLYLLAAAGVFGVWIVGDRVWALGLHLATRTYPIGLTSRLAVSVVSFAIALSLVRMGTAQATPVPQMHRVIVDTEPNDHGAPTSGDTPTAVAVGRWIAMANDAKSPPRPALNTSSAITGPYEVVAGDSLWKIARIALGAGGNKPSGAEIAAYWRAIYQQNRDVIGDNPHLIFPGQILELPGR